MTPADLAEIERALAAATPGPWYASHMPRGSSVYYDEGEVCDRLFSDRDRQQADARLIASAPRWLTELIAALREAQSQRDLAMHWGFDAIDELAIERYGCDVLGTSNDQLRRLAEVQTAALEDQAAEIARLRAELAGEGPGLRDPAAE